MIIRVITVLLVLQVTNAQSDSENPVVATNDQYNKEGLDPVSAEEKNDSQTKDLEDDQPRKPEEDDQSPKNREDDQSKKLEEDDQSPKDRKDDQPRKHEEDDRKDIEEDVTTKNIEEDVTTKNIEEDVTTKNIGEDVTTKDVSEDGQTGYEAPAAEDTVALDAGTTTDRLLSVILGSRETRNTNVDEVEKPKTLHKRKTTVARTREETTIASEGEETSETTTSNIKFRAEEEPETDDVHQDRKPLDLVKVKTESLRKNEKDIWEWDYWCQLQPKMGEGCPQRITRYYYDAQVDQCQQFIYTGCNGNQNNFKTIIECDRHCKGATFMTLRDAEHKPPCDLQPSAGLCLAMMSKYYYDVNEKNCKKFMYGGCGGNENRFDSLERCFDTCQGY